MRARAFVLLALTACGGASDPCGDVDGEVEYVRDGDTVVLATGDVVRYLGIDTPELDACYGDVARDVNATLVAGARVKLTGDARCEDIYGRRLAYVTVDGRDIGAWLLQHGYARLDIIPPDVARESAYKQFEAQAKGAGLGLWSACK